MIKPIIAGVALLSITSCTGLGIQKTDTKPTNNSGEVITVSTGSKTDTQTGEVENMTNTGTDTSTGGTKYTQGQDGAMIQLNYTLREGSEDGKILETTLESVAKENGLYKTGAVYQPFTTFLGRGQVIKGFEKGLMGMKVGDKKMIVVSPEEGYGTGETLTTVPRMQIAPEVEITQDKQILNDTFSNTFDLSVFPDEIKTKISELKVGETFSENGMDAIVKAKTETGVTLEIPNIQSPFYKKEKTVGTKVSTPQADFTIKALTETGVVIDVINKQSPFYNKEFKVGAEVDSNGNKIAIRKIEGDNITIGQTHPLAGKTLYFDVEVLDVQ